MVLNFLKSLYENFRDDDADTTTMTHRNTPREYESSRNANCLSWISPEEKASPSSFSWSPEEIFKIQSWFLLSKIILWFQLLLSFNIPCFHLFLFYVYTCHKLLFSLRWKTHKTSRRCSTKCSKKYVCPRNIVQKLASTKQHPQNRIHDFSPSNVVPCNFYMTSYLLRSCCWVRKKQLIQRL